MMHFALLFVAPVTQALGDLDTLFTPFGGGSLGNVSDVVWRQSLNLTSMTTRNSQVGFAARRQECSPGYKPCSAAGCCQLSENCASYGCCSSGTIECGNSGCYNPSTDICCPDKSGYHCPKGYDCVEGGCCPSGQLRCGASKCYDPKIQQCCQGEGKVWSCSKDSQCCGIGNCYDAETEQCCPNGACDKGTTCCQSQCCLKAATCASDGLCSRTPTPTPTRTSTSTSISTSSITSSCIPVSTRPGKVGQTVTQTINFNYNSARKIKGPDGSRIPAPPRAVLENMCNGIAKMTCSQDQEIELTATSEEQREKNRGEMCPDSWCADAVKAYVEKYYKNNKPEWLEEVLTAASAMQCDEFPFARTHEGGNLGFGTRICLPGTENAWQGGKMGNYFKEFTDKAKTRKNLKYIAEDEKFVVKISGWNCKTMQPDGTVVKPRDVSIGQPRNVERRDVFSDDVDVTGDELYQSIDPENPDLKLAAMPLGDLEAGSYNISLSITRGNLSIEVVDYSGQTFDSTTNTDGSVSFTLNKNAVAVSLIGTTTDDDVEVSYRATTDNGPKPNTTSTRSAASRLSSWSSWLHSFWAILLVLL